MTNDVNATYNPIKPIPPAIADLIMALGLKVTHRGINFADTSDFRVMITRDHLSGSKGADGEMHYKVEHPSGTVFDCHGISWDRTTVFASHTDEQGRRRALPVISSTRAEAVEFV